MKRRKARPWVVLTMVVVMVLAITLPAMADLVDPIPPGGPVDGNSIDPIPPGGPIGPGGPGDGTPVPECNRPYALETEELSYCGEEPYPGWNSGGEGEDGGGSDGGGSDGSAWLEQEGCDWGECGFPRWPGAN
jgi:hypothetical protein